MKTFNELKNISDKFKTSSSIPCNPFLLGSSLKIKIVPLIDNTQEQYETPAFLNLNEQAIYFNPSSKYNQFYIFHEIAHFILNHNKDGLIEEQEANLLASLLIAPLEFIPSYFKTATDLSSFAHMPIDRAEEYWTEIKRYNYLHNKIKPTLLVIFIVCVAFFSLIFFHTQKYISHQTSSASLPLSNTNISEKTYYCTQSGERFHLKDCSSIKNNNTLHKITLSEIQQKNLLPCKKCIKNIEVNLSSTK